MIHGKIKVLSPQYMSKFECIGNACEDTCCKFWRIDIDYDTYKKYIKLSDPKIKYLVSEYVKKNRNESDKNRYAVLKLKKDCKCAFVDEDGLCMLQKKYGYSYLSNVCKTYPRKLIQADDVLERSGTISCPEIARVMLFEEEPMEFDEFLEDIELKSFREHIIDTSAENNGQKRFIKWFWPLRSICIDILQSRNLSVPERLILLGLFIDKLEQDNNNADEEKIHSHIEKYNKLIKSDGISSLLANIPAEGYLQFKMIMEMLIFRLKFASISPSFAKVLEELKLGLKFKEGIKTEELYSNYKCIKEDYWNIFNSKFPQVFENYLVNCAFSSVFPVYPSDNIVENYIRLIISYSVIKLFLVGVGAHHMGYDKTIVQRVFSAVSLTVEHNPEYVDLMVDTIKKYNGNIFAFLTVLIQD